ncbi:MAG: hypothetical protein HYX41_03505 [Bdellovibrio sp.]|nr:hypothetical protein [Bdellovibrio sp.]
MTLSDYNRKRKFHSTPEPKGTVQPKSKHTTKNLKFVVQMHQASRLHFDFRLEVDGVLKSWAIPRGPSMNSQDQRLAVHVEDHPMAYAGFEGIIPKGNYGAGTVMVWDEGTYLERNSETAEASEKAILKGIEEGHITFLLHGKKLRGEFALIRLKEKSRNAEFGVANSVHGRPLHKGMASTGNTRSESHAWLLIKKRDEFSTYKIQKNNDVSVKTGRTLTQISNTAESKGEVWLPARRKNKPPQPSKAPPAPRPTSSRKEPLMQLEALPRRVKPMIPVVQDQPFDREDWYFEYDRQGIRAIAEMENGSVHLHSRHLLPFNSKFPEIVDSLRTEKIRAILDGEIVETENGPVFWVRDLLHLEGKPLHKASLSTRKRELEKLSIFSARIVFNPHIQTQGKSLWKKAQREGIPSLLARDSQEPYHFGTHPSCIRIPIQEKAPVQLEQPRLTHLDKVYWPKEGITKGDLIEYYRKIAPFLLEHLKDRPQSMHRFPDGVGKPGFFHKDLVGHHPKWAKTLQVSSHHRGRSINYLLCQNQATLLYMINLGCIELNPWLSRKDSLDEPDFVVIDLDPDDNPISEIVEVANSIHKVLKKIGAIHGVKTSGNTGLHIYIPVQPGYSYDQTRNFALEVCQVVHQKYKNSTSLERSPAKRRKKIYLDCFQNSRGQTVASIYCVRPVPGAQVSTPLKWSELTPKLDPTAFNINSVLKRVEKMGDLWKPLLTEKVDLEACVLKLRKFFPIGK